MSRTSKPPRAASRKPQPSSAAARHARPPRPLFPARDAGRVWTVLAWVALVPILAYGLWLQSPGLDNPILERLHGWREAQTAMTSRNFVRDGMNPLVARVDYIGDGQMQLELPVYQYLVSICYCIFGVHEVWGRIIALVFGMGSAVVLFLMGRMVWSTLAGLLAAAVFSWSPLDVYFNRAFLPDSSTIFFTLLALWMFLRFFRDARMRDLVIACAAIALALAGKPPIAVTVAPPLAVALFLSHGWRIWKQPRLLIGLAAAFVFFAAWMLYSYHVNNHKSDNLREAGLSFTNAGEDNKDLMAWYFGSHAQRADPRTYERIFSRVPDWVGHWFPALAATASKNVGFTALLEFVGHYGLIGLALLGVLLSWRSRMQWILSAWFLGCLAYIWIFLGVNWVHDYYQMPIVPMLAIAAAFGVERIIAAVARLFTRSANPQSAIRNPQSRLSVPRVMVGTVLALAFCSAQAYAGFAVLRDFDARNEYWAPGQRLYWSVFTHFVTLGGDIHKHLPDTPGLLALVGPGGIVVDCRDPQLLYPINRRGFVIQAPDSIAKAAESESIADARAGRIPAGSISSVKNQRITAWVTKNFSHVFPFAIRKGVRILVVVYPQNVLGPAQQADLDRRHKLHYRDPAGQFDIYILTPENTPPGIAR